MKIRRWDTDETIHEGDFETIRELLEDGVKKKISFYRAKLNYAELNGAKLNGAKLNYAELNDAKLNYAELNDAKLNYAELNGNIGETISIFNGGKHQGIATCTHISIGCQRHTHAEWRENYQAIGEKAEYTPAQIERYRAWIFSLDFLIEMAGAQ